MRYVDRTHVTVTRGCRKELFTFLNCNEGDSRPRSDEVKSRGREAFYWSDWTLIQFSKVDVRGLNANLCSFSGNHFLRKSAAAIFFVLALFSRWTSLQINTTTCRGAADLRLRLRILSRNWWGNGHFMRKKTKNILCFPIIPEYPELTNEYRKGSCPVSFSAFSNIQLLSDHSASVDF